MRTIFELASGSVTGRNHIHEGRNNQDAYYILEDQDLLVAVVCDGCSESAHSEVGSVLGSRLVTQAVIRNAKKNLGTSKLLTLGSFWEKVRQDVLAAIRVFALQMGESLSEVVMTHFLFTVVGVFVTPDVSVFFSIGDGTFFVNGEKYPLGPFPDNEPPYFAYGGLVETTREYDPIYLSFQTLVFPTDEVGSFLIATDGVDDLIKAEGKTFPGKGELVRSIDELWTEDKFFLNKSNLTRRLNLLNAEARIPDWDRRGINRYPGLLHDDTTIVVARRRV